MVEEMETTIAEFAENNGLEYAAAGGFLKSLLKLGIATLSEPLKKGKGKPTMVYKLPKEITLKLK